MNCRKHLNLFLYEHLVMHLYLHVVRTLIFFRTLLSSYNNESLSKDKNRRLNYLDNVPQIHKKHKEQVLSRSVASPR